MNGLVELSSRTALPLYHFAWAALDWIFPPRCAGCSKPGTRWCDECSAATPAIANTICPHCGLPGINNSLCSDCTKKPPSFHLLRSFSIYRDPLKRALQSLKYHNDLGLGEVFSSYLLTLLFDFPETPEIVVPVPLSKSRFHERGYNQAGVIAFPLSLALRASYQPRALVRTRDTRSQVRLSAQERSSNVAGAFSGNPSLVSGKIVMVVDDIATTCSTLISCSSALLEAGAKEVYCLTVARAVLLEHHV